MLYPLSYGAVGSCPGARLPDRYRSPGVLPTPERSSARGPDGARTAQDRRPR